MKIKHYLKIEEKNLPNFFKQKGNRIYLKNPRATPIEIKFPLILDEKIAKVAGMLMDGSLDKNLERCMFCQKKDLTKMKECSEIIKEKFNFNPYYYIRKEVNTHSVTVGKVLATFFYHCLDMHKCDEDARIPKWIWQSPTSVIREYIRYAYAMEGSVTEPPKSPEIRFHSVDPPYLQELKKLLKQEFAIDSKILSYHIKDYGWKYYLCITSYTNVKKFHEQIGIALDSHTKRLAGHVNNIKSKAWEIALVKIIDLGFWPFSIKDLHESFPKLCFRSVHQRIQDLCKLRYVEKSESGYILTWKGLYASADLYSSTKISSLRTDPRKNERLILAILAQKGKSFKAELSKELDLNDNTVRDTLRRLIKQEKIQFIEQDQFGRKFYACA